MNAAVTISEDEGTFRGKGGALFRRSVVPPNPWATIAFVHGYGEHCARYLHFYRWMAERGVACHTFDFRGQGKSAGRRAYVRRWDEYIDHPPTFLPLTPLPPHRPP